jgi:hypothetical protein
LEQALGPDSSLVTRSRFARVVVLSGLGREDEAVRQANPGLQRLLQQAAQLDEMFLSRLGGSLDPLRDRGLAPPPEPSQGWRQALLTAHAAGRAGADLDEAQ